MSHLLDFLTQPRDRLHPGVTHGVQLPELGPADEPGAMSPVAPRTIGVGDVQQMQGGPQVTEEPSLLSGIWDYLKSPQNLAAVGAALKGLSGDDTGVSDAMQIGEMRRQEALTAQQLAQKRQALKAKNAALRAAYKPDASGKTRFDPGAYIAALQEADTDAEPDLGELANMHNAFAPKVGVSGDTPYSIDDEGQVEWGKARDPSEAERLAAARAEEIERHNREMERLMAGRGEAYDYSVHHKGGGGGGRGGGASWLPPGAKVVHVPGGQ